MHPHPRHPCALLTTLGSRLRALRQARGWTRRELARQSGVSERFLAEIESGRGNPSLLRVQDLASSLGTTPAALLNPTPEPLHPQQPQHPQQAEQAQQAQQAKPAPRKVVALLGLRGAGKSSVGAALATTLGWQLVELDAVIEEQAGSSVGEMFELHGPAYYRRQERHALESLLAGGAPIVLATGGGLVTEPATFELLRRAAHTVWLRAAPEDHWARVVAQGDLRPMAGNDEAFAHLCAILEERERLYARAEVTVETSGKPLAAVCAELAARFGGGAAAG